jgi:hypothetical protein
MSAAVSKLISAFGTTLIERNGHAYASGYLESLCNTIAQRLSDEEQRLLVEDLADRLAKEVMKPRA